jgi:hypothetical protein
MPRPIIVKGETGHRVAIALRTIAGILLAKASKGGMLEGDQRAGEYFSMRDAPR